MNVQISSRSDIPTIYCDIICLDTQLYFLYAVASNSGLLKINKLIQIVILFFGAKVESFGFVPRIEGIKALLIPHIDQFLNIFKKNVFFD